MKLIRLLIKAPSVQEWHAIDRPSTEITEKLLERWRATEVRHTMSKEIIHLLAMALPLESSETDVARLVGQIEAQVQTWRQLAGRRESDVEAAEEIERLYAARSAGRPVEL